MKKISMVVAGLAFVAVLFTGVSSVFAEALILELKVSAKGYGVDVDDEAKLSVKTIVYAIFQGSEFYFACQGSKGWNVTGPLPVSLVEVGDLVYYIPDLEVDVCTPDTLLEISLTARIQGKKDWTSAKFSALGAHVVGGQTSGGWDVYGGAQVKGKMIDFEKLPQDVRDALTP
jgi:Phr family secreted Rap phosphatase inhibitor